ncbi:MAG: hypothetical protein RDV48_28895 [Candidatus Eremiobacteraeota bacterium]|nr:hypothetical protein [Candidatus Eremiobacteraeota bacterium]
MKELIAYKLKKDQVLTYEQGINMLLKSRDGETAAGRSTSKSRLKVLDVAGDGNMTIEMTQEPLTFEGILMGSLPEEFTRARFSFAMKPDGTLTDVSGESAFPHTASFPSQPVGEGEGWVAERGTSVTEYVVLSFEKKKDELIAHLVSTAHDKNELEGLDTTVESTIDFSLTRGCHLQSTSVIEMAYADGRTLSIVMENALAGSATTTR